MDTKLITNIRHKLTLAMLMAAIIVVIASPVTADKQLVAHKSADYEQILEKLTAQAVRNGKSWSSRRSYPYLHKANKLYEEGDYEGAAGELSTYLKSVPDDPTALWRLANMEVALERYTSAAEHYALLAATLPRFGAAHLRAAIATKKLGKTREAKAAFIYSVKTETLSLDDQTYALKELSAIETANGNYEKASQYLDFLLSNSPRDSELLHQQAVIKTQLGDYEQAANNLEAYLRFAPHNEDKQPALESLVFLYSKTKPKDLHRNLGQLQRAYRPAFKHCQLALQTAYIYIDGNSHKEAYSTLLNADASQRSCGEKYRDYLEAVTSVSIQLKEHAITGRYLDQLIRLARTNKEKSQWLTMKGNVNYATKKLPQALDTYVEAEALHHSSDTKSKASEVAWQLKDYEKVATLLSAEPDIAINPEKLSRVCSAYLQQKQYSNALPCYQRLAKINPENADNHLIIAGIAKATGQPDMELDHAKIAFAMTRDSKLGINIGNMIKDRDEAAAKRWFRQVDLQTGSKIAALNVFIELDENTQTNEVITRGSKLLQSKHQFNKQQLILINRKLAYAYQKKQNWAQSANAWTRSFQHSRSADDLINIVSHTHTDRNFERTLSLLQQINPERLPEKNKADYYRLAASTYFHFGDYAQSEDARKYLVAIEPTAQNWFSLAIVQIEREKYPAAEHALDEALTLDPGNKTYLMNKAYIAGNNQNYDHALAILTRMPEQGFDADLNENTAYISLKAGKPQLAANYFRKALENHGETSQGGQQVDMKLLALRDNIRQIESKHRIQAAQVGCFGSESCQPTSGIQETESGYGFGNIRANYFVHPKLAARAALLWNNKNDSLEPIRDSATAAVGVEYKPLDKTNLKLSIDRLIKIGDLGQDNTLLRAAWSTNLSEATQQARRQRYTQIYTEANALLENNQEKQILAEARTGLIMNTDTIDLLNPYLYGQIRHQDSKALDYTIAEAGIGLSATIKHAKDKYKGNRASSTLFAKTGAELYNSESDKEIRALIGYEFSYQ